MTDQLPQKTSKRIRNQTDTQRDYGCPCGKTYLSYPALFTHIKYKHDGKAPGKLVKPTPEKARGRPKIYNDTPQDGLSDDSFNLQQEIENALSKVRVQYDQIYFKSYGRTTCQDMGTEFLEALMKVDSQKMAILNCFMKYLQYVTQQRLGYSFWVQKHPNDLIDLVNQMCRNHKHYAQMFPLERRVLVNLLNILFRWMYLNGWTDHKLIKKQHTKKM